MVNWNGAITLLRVWRNTITIHDIGSVPLHFHKSLKYTIAYPFDQLSEFLDQTALIFLLCPSSLFHFIRADQHLGIAGCNATPQLVCVPPHTTMLVGPPPWLRRHLSPAQTRSAFQCRCSRCKSMEACSAQTRLGLLAPLVPAPCGGGQGV